MVVWAAARHGGATVAEIEAQEASSGLHIPPRLTDVIVRSGWLDDLGRGEAEAVVYLAGTGAAALFLVALMYLVAQWRVVLVTGTLLVVVVEAVVTGLACSVVVLISTVLVVTSVVNFDAVMEGRSSSIEVVVVSSLF